ncbi:T9SS type A sorting domain-containing protein [Flavobacterium pectinovorum]|uniref:T9SS C-terminal target domain-containing protein n=1 Tax=Flavobacterium pectinovorum TaxID=29533 RepID=A0A502EZY2_9FLAO|nr:T9SS type A sorting domain-containing protein [Flavobacterium pectinovorum]TPG41741.1 T9SS C-terminal target domain-containing protein [Flavobacterium pectinovorum]
MKTKLLLFLLAFVIVNVNAQQVIYNTSGNPSSFIKFNDKIFFEAYNQDSGSEIWQSDGTSSNTSILKDIYPGSESGSQNFLKTTSTILKDKLYFIAKDENSLGEIWKTDGTANGTTKVTNFLNGRVWRLTAAGDYIYFLITQDNNTLQVWKTDGTEGGTVLVKDNLSIWNGPTFQGKCNDIFIFTFQPYGTNNTKVWRSSGTADGTYPITEELDGNGSGVGGTSALSQYIEFNNKLYFVSRLYLHETDGTSQSIIGNVQSNMTTYSDAIVANDNLYFMFFSEDNNSLSVWKFDKKDRSIGQIYTNYGSNYFSPSNFAKTNDALLFSGSNPTGGTSLISLDLATNEASYLKELSDNKTEKPFLFTENLDRNTISLINNDQYFITSAIDKNYARKGWITNITAKTTENIADLNDVWGSISHGDYLYYIKDSKFMKYAKNLGTGSIIDYKRSLVLYPNPSSNFIQIEANDIDLIESINVFDLSGKEVINRSDYSNGKIDISKLSQGTYIFRIKLNGAFIEKKIIKR